MHGRIVSCHPGINSIPVARVCWGSILRWHCFDCRDTTRRGLLFSWLAICVGCLPSKHETLNRTTARGRKQVAVQRKIRECFFNDLLFYRGAWLAIALRQCLKSCRFEISQTLFFRSSWNRHQLNPIRSDLPSHINSREKPGHRKQGVGDW